MESTSSFGNETLTMGMCLCHNNFQLTAYIRVIKFQKILNNSISISRAVIPLLPEWIVLLLGSLGLGMLHGVIQTNTLGLSLSAIQWVQLLGEEECSQACSSPQPLHSNAQLWPSSSTSRSLVISPSTKV